MSLQSLPAVVLASIVMFIGAHNLGVFFRRPAYRAHLTFFLTCLTIGFYDVACAFLYSAPTWVEGATWQRLQFVSTALICGIMPWFLFEYFHDVLPVSRRMKKVTAALAGFFMLAAIGVIANPGGLFWSGKTPLVKTIRLPLGITVVYNEVALGPLIDVVNLFVFVFVVLLTFLIIREVFRGSRKGILPLAVVMVLILVCLLNDTLVARGALPFVYTAEYALMGFAMLISQSLSRKVVEAGRTQEALQASEARYQSVFRHSAVSLWIEDIGALRALLGSLRSRGVTDLAAHMHNHPDFVMEAVHSIRVVDVNDATLRLYEAADKEEFLGPADRTLDPDAIPHFADSILSIARGEDGYEKESMARTIRGKRLDIIVSAHIPRQVEDGNRMLVSVTDISARKRAEEKLRSFIEQSTEAIFLLDETGRVEEFNPSAERLLGVSRAQVISRPVWELMARSVPEERRTPELVVKLQEGFLEAYTNSAAVFLKRPIVGILQRPDGSRRDYVQSVFPIRLESGLLLGGIIHDTTEARRTEEALRQSEERLRQAQKMEAVGTLAGGMAHDFNNLLTGILGSASLLMDQLPADGRFTDDVKAIESSALRAADLARQILTFSRQDPRIDMRPLNPNAVVGEVVRLLERTIDKSISIATRLAGAPPWIRGNAGQIHQAILNLCLNARDAMPQGGALLIETARETAPETEGGERSTDRVVISVTDTGIGITKKQRERIFEPFYTTKEQGRGLGLPMVYGIARGHGGDVEVRSEPGKGTTFRLLIPATGDRPAGDAQEAPRPRGGSETVLVIDDEPQVRRVAARILERAGYTVLQAEDGARGLALFGQRRGAVDLVVLDISMPGMGGAEVHERLMALDPGVKVIFSSGYSDDERVSDILAKGVMAFLHKPYTTAEVQRTVREVLDG